ncbi:MAG: macrolide 2'-phosphotransferase [Nesterenkonia sp.]|uniref:macrolide 2'-phosphotransferase n=1 Tax=Nesterenkonia marinintestina TaxID=2979865 RepID=UPI0021C23AE7|nr:macrolide 2'-phosphotransferase [Nesterenkonia sp. GX14115]MDO5493471.1 macrolide 2'-phosphotransferase [Nesterenkonia sp.]
MSALTLSDALSRAAGHGLSLDEAGAAAVDSGLDFFVVMASDAAGIRWVLRLPRRDDVVASVDTEARLLDLVAEHLTVAVPDWRIRGEDLVAYPMLPGSPGLTIGDDGPEWHVDPGSRRYAVDLGRILADLHRVPVEEARGTGVPVRSPDEVREQWRENVEAVAAEFTVEDRMLARWRRWIDDDSFWPERTVLTHGEIYPAHTTLDVEGSIVGILDWTTARVDDPARDLMHQHMTAPQETFELTLGAYEQAGGHLWPRVREHCGEYVAAAPVGYALFAMTTGSDSHRRSAQTMLDVGL